MHHAPAFQVRRLVSEHPEVAATVQSIAAQQETDLLVSEALRQLRLVSTTAAITASAIARVESAS
jgi:hypothetical protein